MFGTRPNNYYEIHRSPGQQEKHTLYVIGAEGDMVAQYSRGDAILLNQMASNDWLVNPFCKDVNIDCDTYWKNRVGFAFVSFLEDTNIYVDGKLREGHKALPWLALLGFLFWVVYQTKDQTEDANVENQTVDLFGISLLPSFTNRIQKQIPRYGTALLVVVFSFTTTAGCFPLLLGGGEAESGTPIWLLGLGNGIPADTQSVADEPGQGGSGGGGTSTGNARVEGMYFYHPDHLGSITMITDGHGNVLAGGERGGKSHITYKPYGEIFRTDSYGPDITKFKYTGKEEDQKSGLYYYKARYYDASLGRFVSNDGQVFPDKEQGMNRMMYVEGNPIAFVDPSGRNKHIHMFNRIAGHAMGKDFGDKGGSFSTNKVWNGVKNYKMYDKVFGKFDEWYGRNIRRDKFENTSNYHLYLFLHLYTRSDDCKKKFGANSCQLMFLLNGVKMEASKEKYEGNLDPFMGMWSWKIRPDTEDSRRVENDSAKVICLNYFQGRAGTTPTDRDYVAGMACAFSASSSNSLPSAASNDGYFKK